MITAAMAQVRVIFVWSRRTSGLKVATSIREKSSTTSTVQILPRSQMPKGTATTFAIAGGAMSSGRRGGSPLAGIGAGEGPAASAGASAARSAVRDTLPPIVGSSGGMAGILAVIRLVY